MKRIQLAIDKMATVEETRMPDHVPYPHIVKEGSGPARLANTPRMKVSHLVIEYLNWGWSPEEMCHQHPFLAVSEAYAAMAYYFDHQAEIDAEIEADDNAARAAMHGASSSPLLQRLRSQRAR
jgi:uncharacterized protein (DUF433 family)